MKYTSDRSTTQGFTIIELLVAMVVIAILATIGIVGYSSFSTRVPITTDLLMPRPR